MNEIKPSYLYKVRISGNINQIVRILSAMRNFYGKNARVSESFLMEREYEQVEEALNEAKNKGEL